MHITTSIRMTIVALSACLAGVAGAGAIAARSETDWTLGYDKQSARFTARSELGSICDRFGPGAVSTDDGSGCWYAPSLLGFLSEFGFDGDANGFTVTDASGDVLVLEEGRAPQQGRYDVQRLHWANIDASEELLARAATATGAVVGDGIDMSDGPRVALFLELDEPPIWDGDTIALNINTYADDDVGNDMSGSLDPSDPAGGGDVNILAGWSYVGSGERANAASVWSQGQGATLPANLVAGPSEQPPGVWAILGPELLGDRINSVFVSQPMYAPMLVDRVDGASGPFAWFDLDGNTQAYFDGFTLSGTANVPGNDFEVVFHTPFAPLFEGGTATIGFIMDGQEQSFSKELETTDQTIRLGLSLPTGETGLTAIELLPAAKTKVAVDGRKKPVAVRNWRKGPQLAEINAAARDIMRSSMPTRFELAEGQVVRLGAGPS